MAAVKICEAHATRVWPLWCPADALSAVACLSSTHPAFAEDSLASSRETNDSGDLPVAVFTLDAITLSPAPRVLAMPFALLASHHSANTASAAAAGASSADLSTPSETKSEQQKATESSSSNSNAVIRGVGSASGDAEAMLTRLMDSLVIECSASKQQPAPANVLSASTDSPTTLAKARAIVRCRGNAEWQRLFGYSEEELRLSIEQIGRKALWR